MGVVWRPCVWHAIAALPCGGLEGRVSRDASRRTPVAVCLAWRFCPVLLHRYLSRFTAEAAWLLPHRTQDWRARVLPCLRRLRSRSLERCHAVLPDPGAPGGPAGAPAVRAADRGSEAELWRLVPCILHPCITRLTAQDATLLPHREPGRAQGSHPVCGGEALSSDVTLCCAPRCPWRPCRRIRSTRG